MTEENTDQTQTEEASPEVISRAKEMGWRSPEEWKGPLPKDGLLDPAEYVRRSEKIMPIVRAEAKKWQDEAKKLRDELDQTKAEHRDTIKRIERMSTVALEQQRNTIEARYADLKEKAVETGDKAAYAEAVKQEKQATKALDDRLAEDDDKGKTKEGKDDAPKLPKKVQEDIDAWLADNAWFNSDEELNAIANARHRKLIKDKPGLTLTENLNEVRDYVKKKFPEKFGAADDATDEQDERPRGSRVEGGSRIGGGNGASKFAKLPADAKAACDRFIKDDGLFLAKGETAEKNLAQARERYATQYFGD